MTDKHPKRSNSPLLWPDDPDILKAYEYACLLAVEPLLWADHPAVLKAYDEACLLAVKRGVIVDSGKRKWSENTRRYEIVWESTIAQSRGGGV